MWGGAYSDWNGVVPEGGSSCVSWYSHLFSSALTDSEKACLVAAEKAQIGQVGANVKAYYPDNGPLQEITKTVVTQQQAQVEGDVNAVAAMNSDCTGLDLSGVGLGCYNSFNDFLSSFNTAVKIALAVGVIIGIIYVWTVFVAPFAKVRR